VLRNNRLINLAALFSAIVTGLAVAAALTFHAAAHYYYQRPVWSRAHRDTEIVEVICLVSIAALCVINRIFFMVWMYFAYRNLERSGVYRTEYKSFMVFIWFLVPFANFVFPPKMLIELWRENNRILGVIRRSPPETNNTLPVFYSALCMILFAVNCIAFPVSIRYNNFPAHIYYPSCLLIVAMVVSTVYLLRKIQAQEDEISTAFLSAN
jgi:hypothetical protein